MSACELSCLSLTVSVPGRVLVRNIDLACRGGELLCVLGVNGAGKTTLLHSLAGLRAPTAGEVLLDGRPLADTDRRRRARRLGLMFQHHSDAFPATVMDQAMTGRHPHLRFWDLETGADRQAARSALARVDLATLAARDVHSLSGGERRRLAAATLLTQDPQICLADEPVNHLDPAHQLSLLQVFRELADAGRAVVLSLHDVNLAARFADRILLLYGDGRWECGAAEDVLEPQRLAALYGVPMQMVPLEYGRVFVAGGPPD